MEVIEFINMEKLLFLIFEKLLIYAKNLRIKELIT